MGLILLICVLAVPCHLLELLLYRWVFFRVRHRHGNQYQRVYGALFDRRSVSDFVVVACVLTVFDLPLIVYLASNWT